MVNKTLNKKTNVFSYIISDLDVLYHIILPFFSKLQFKTRKLIDFNLFCVAIKLHIQGYYLTPEGRALLLKITKSSNKARYGNNVELPNQIEIDNIFNAEPPFDINSGKTHTLLAQEYLRIKGSRSGFEVYVYKKNIFIGHFSSYNEAQNKLKIKGNRTISRLIDTEKASKLQGYKFYSKPLTPFQ